MTEREIFEQALDITDLALRAMYLDSVCTGDASLRARIEALLASHLDESRFLNVPAMERMNPATTRE